MDKYGGYDTFSPERAWMFVPFPGIIFVSFYEKFIIFTIVFM